MAIIHLQVFLQEPIFLNLGRTATFSLPNIYMLQFLLTLLTRTSLPCQSVIRQNSTKKLTTSKVTFTWDAIPDAIKYKLQLSTKPDFSVLLLNVRTTEPTYFFDTFLQYSKTYYWRIKPIFADSKVPWLSTWQFTSMDRLIKPELLSPDHNQILDSSEVTLFWNPVENATTYKVIIAKDALFTNKVAARSTESTSEMFNLPDGRYYWKVKAIDLYGTKSPWSDYRIFKVNVP